jgi:hypothetical protein
VLKDKEEMYIQEYQILNTDHQKLEAITSELVECLKKICEGTGNFIEHQENIERGKSLITKAEQL